MGLPLVNIFMIAARQLSKPVADTMMQYGKTHLTVRDKILVPIGKGLVHMTTRLRMKNLGLGAPSSFAPISESAALEQASEFIQQIVIFGYSVGVFAAYYYYSKLNEKEVVSADDFRKLLLELDTRFASLESRLDQIDTQIQDINRGIVGKLFRSKNEPPQAPKSNPTQSLMSSLPFDEALKKLSQPQATANNGKPAENRTITVKPADSSIVQPK